MRLPRLGQLNDSHPCGGVRFGKPKPDYNHRPASACMYSLPYCSRSRPPIYITGSDIYDGSNGRLYIDAHDYNNNSSFKMSEISILNWLL